MICKYCGQELPEDSTFCSFCGQSLEEAPVEAAEETPVAAIEEAAEEAPVEAIEEAAETVSGTAAEEADEESAGEAAENAAEEAAEEAQAESIEDIAAVTPAKPKVKAWKVILAVLGGLILAAALAVLILTGMGVDLRPRANDILYKDNYSVEDKVAVAKANDVIATVGDIELTNGELQVYYWETVYSYINNNYYYLSMYGLDTTKPLNEQPFYGDASKTWQQFFLETALSSWQRYTTLQLLSKDADYTFDAEMQAFMDGLDETVKKTATNAGYDSVDAWLAENCGVGCNEAGYLDYVHAYYESTAYLVSRYDELTPTAQEVEDYFTANEAAFTQNGITKDGGKYYDVRHILIGIEGGTQQEDGTVVYTDAEWEACRAKAQALLDEFLDGEATEDQFATLAMLHSGDGGSSTNGGLYTDLTAETNFVQEFKDWYLDASRAPGDTGLVKSIHGYHIMYFSASRDIWYTSASEQLLAERVSALIDAGMEQFPMQTNYKKIVLGTKDKL